MDSRLRPASMNGQHSKEDVAMPSLPNRRRRVKQPITTPRDDAVSPRSGSPSTGGTSCVYCQGRIGRMVDKAEGKVQGDEEITRKKRWAKRNAMNLVGSLL